ncbi:MAG TPA: glycosyltransferase family 2 protein [Nitrospira sp.]|nr:glycosyltransferase family 2 protein [Nitrospira sp.]
MELLTIAHIALFASLGLLGYSYAGYPLMLWLFSRLQDEEWPLQADPAVWPDVSVVIAAHNEELVIGRRIDNLLALDYPPERLQILIGSDGSTDRTSEIVRLYHRPKIAFHDFALQRGKAQVLNDLVAVARGRFVVFTDANTFFEPNAVKELIRGFRRTPSACAVVGKLEFRTAEGTVNPDGLYWRYETLLKTLESRFGTVLGANGAIYAVKRAWFQALPPGTIVDDFLIPMLMRLERGGSVVFRPTARAWEMVPETVRDEFRRRVRIGAGDAHALRHTWPLLLPQYGMLALCYWSHKILRWIGPALLVIVFVSNCWLVEYPWGRALLTAQIAFYGLGLAAPWLRNLPILGPVSTGVWYFIVLNAALLLGALKYLTGRAAPVWQRTPRKAERMAPHHIACGHTTAAARSEEDSPAA